MMTAEDGAMPPPPPRQPRLPRTEDDDANPFQVPVRKHSLPPGDTSPPAGATVAFATPHADGAPVKATMTRPTGSPVTPFPARTRAASAANASYGVSALLNSGLYAPEGSAAQPERPAGRSLAQAFRKLGLRRGGAAAQSRNAIDASDDEDDDDTALEQERAARQSLEDLFALQQKQVRKLEAAAGTLGRQLATVEAALREQQLDGALARTAQTEREEVLQREVAHLRQRCRQLELDVDAAEKRAAARAGDAEAAAAEARGLAWDAHVTTDLLKRNEMQLLEMSHALAEVDAARTVSPDAVANRLAAFIEDAAGPRKDKIVAQQAQIEQLQKELAALRVRNATAAADRIERASAGAAADRAAAAALEARKACERVLS